jgi:hypothetical protein
MQVPQQKLGGRGSRYAGAESLKGADTPVELGELRGFGSFHKRSGFLIPDQTGRRIVLQRKHRRVTTLCQQGKIFLPALTKAEWNQTGYERIRLVCLHSTFTIYHSKFP